MLVLLLLVGAVAGLGLGLGGVVLWGLANCAEAQAEARDDCLFAPEGFGSGSGGSGN